MELPSSLDDLAAQEKLRHRCRADKPEQRNQQCCLEVRAAPVFEPQCQDDEHGLDEQGIEGQHPVLPPWPEQQSCQRQEHCQGQAAEGEHQRPVEEWAHWKISIRSRSYRCLMNRTSAASSSNERTCRRTSGLSAESCTQTVPGVNVTIMASTASPFGSSSSSGISTNARRVPGRGPASISRATWTLERSISSTTRANRRRMVKGLRTRTRVGLHADVAAGQNTARIAPSASVPALADCIKRIQRTSSPSDSSGDGRSALISALRSGMQAVGSG